MALAPLTPGDAHAVFDCLRGCLSQDARIQKQAEAALVELGPRSGFCSCLAEIIVCRDADHSARWIAAVHFKNTVNKYWRSRMPGSLSEEEKAHLRSRFLMLLDQEDSQIAVQAALVVAKVARLDFPRSWPSLFNELLHRLQGAAAAGPDHVLTVRRCYLALHHILKELSSKRLASDQRSFESVTGDILEPLWVQWNADTATLVAGLPAALNLDAATAADKNRRSNVLLLTFERWLLQLKCLHRLLVFGFPSDAKCLEAVGPVGRISPSLVNALGALLMLVPQYSSTGPTPPRTQLGVMLERGCLKLVKTVHQITEVHPWTIYHSGTLVPALELCCGEVLTPRLPTATSTGTAFLRQCLRFIHMAIRCLSYRGSPASLSLGGGKGKELTAKVKEMSAHVHPSLQAFWSSKQRKLTEVIVARFFPLTEKELEMWDDSGEEFHAEMEHTSQDESLRGCAEQAFVSLLEYDRDAMAPLVLEMLQQVCSSGDDAHLGSPLPGVGEDSHGVTWVTRLKAAVYHAVTMGSYELHEAVDLSAWLHNSLLHELHDTSRAMRPIRRAAIKLVAAWTTKLVRKDRPPVYAALVAALGDSDPAIHLAAATALHGVVDDWEFDDSQFAEFVPHCFQRLSILLQTTHELDAQLEIFGLINVIVDRLGPGGAMYCPGLLALLPSVWKASEGQSLLRIQILVALQRIVHILGAESAISYPILIPVLGVSCDPTQPDELTVLEDGLLLWLVALRHAPAPHPGLLAPMGYLLRTMERSTEHIAVGSRVLSSSLLLGGQEVVASHGPAIAHTLAGLIGNVKDRGMLVILPVMDLVIQLDPSNGPALLTPALVALMKDVLWGTEPAMVVAPAVNVFARLLLLNTVACMELFRTAVPHIAVHQLPRPGSVSGAQPEGDPASLLLVAILDIWLDTFDALSNPAARKLSALGLCALLAAPVVGVLDRCEAMVAAITAVWFELECPTAGPEKLGVDYLAAYSIPRDDDLPLAVNLEEAEGEAARRRALFDQSPVALLSLGSFCKEQLESSSRVHSELNKSLNAIDPALAVQLQQLLNV